MRRPESIVNLLQDGDSFRIIPEQEMALLKMRNEVILLKTRKQGPLYGYFYRRKDDSGQENR
jgi:hypothetical protein